MRIAVVGSGYVGLVSGACLADFGHNVHCVDVSEQKIAALQDGQIPIFEPGLEAMVKSGIANGRLEFSGDVAAAVCGADLVFVAVGSPPAGAALDARRIVAPCRITAILTR